MNKILQPIHLFYTLIIFHSDSIVHFPLNNKESLASADHHRNIFVTNMPQGLPLYSKKPVQFCTGFIYFVHFTGIKRQIRALMFISNCLSV